MPLKKCSARTVFEEAFFFRVSGGSLRFAFLGAAALAGAAGFEEDTCLEEAALRFFFLAKKTRGRVKTSAASGPAAPAASAEAPAREGLAINLFGFLRNSVPIVRGLHMLSACFGLAPQLIQTVKGAGELLLQIHYVAGAE